MKIDLIEILRDNDIKIVNKILDKRNGLGYVGYHLHSPSIEKHKDCIFIIAKYMMGNDNPYSITDGSNNKDIFLHIN